MIAVDPLQFIFRALVEPRCKVDDMLLVSIAEVIVVSSCDSDETAFFPSHILAIGKDYLKFIFLEKHVGSYPTLSSKFYKYTLSPQEMQIQYLKQEKNEIELELGSVTMAELLRSYLQEDDSVVLAAWRRDHPTKDPLLKIKTKEKTAKKALHDAVARIEKELDKLESSFKKAK